MLTRVRGAIRLRHYSRRTEKAYVGRIKAVSALLVLYREVLGRSLAGLDEGIRAKRPEHLPVVLSRGEVQRILDRLRGPSWLVASLLYGSGLPLIECLSLRVKDIDLSRGEVTVRDGKGQKDRVTVLAAGCGQTVLPDALERKYPNAAAEWGWQWVFPATRHYVHPRLNRRCRHHLHETVQRQVQLRHPDDPRAARPQRRRDHHDRHACPQSRGQGSPQPIGR